MGAEHEVLVRSWGFNHVFTWHDGPWVHPEAALLVQANDYVYANSTAVMPTTHLIPIGV